MTSHTKHKESGFSRYLRRSMSKDPKFRTLFLAEVNELPVASRRRVLRHFRFLNDHRTPSKYPYSLFSRRRSPFEPSTRSSVALDGCADKFVFSLVGISAFRPRSSMDTARGSAQYWAAFEEERSRPVDRLLLLRVEENTRKIDNSY